MRRYDFREIESKWQKRWREDGTFRFDRTRPAEEKYYVLVMLPYPSGALHMGHVLNYSIGDSVVRWHRMRGKNVFSPMGWDSFGLPAENAAIKAGKEAGKHIHPADWTESNIAHMREQIGRAGWAYDWSTEIASHTPEYYKWTQWLFLELFERGLAYRKHAAVNWCPSCATVLANEQVVDGTCERCGSKVEPKDLEQWFFKQSAYAQRLLDGHASLRGGAWPEQRVIKRQEDWIGRSEGARIDFTIDALGSDAHGERLSVFTTRPDTVFGVTFLAIAPEHPLVPRLVRGTAREADVSAAVLRMRSQSMIERTSEESEKEGVATGRHIVNPFDGSRAEIWVTNYALMDYGTGAVMAVPAHDQRDFLFAKKYGLPIEVVVQPADAPAPLGPSTMSAAFVGEGVQCNSGAFDGLPNEEGKRRITEHARERGFGDFTVTYRLKDWTLSRQRYWGAPIPIVYCDACGVVPVPESDLPVLLPRDVEFQPGGASPLARRESFVKTACPRCRAPARRETDTMDTFVDSSWYFLRYTSPCHQAGPFDRSVVSKLLPVDQYIGGSEHATMHLIFARFFTMVLHDAGLVPFDEPFARLFCQGMVCKTGYWCPNHFWLREAEVNLPADGGREGDVRCKECDAKVVVALHKMSKTKRNGVSPDEILEQFGADAAHVGILFMSPADADIDYQDQGMAGASRFVKRLFEAVAQAAEDLAGVAPHAAAGGGSALDATSRELRRKTHEVIKRVTDAFESRSFAFNTCISGAMELLNLTKDSATAANWVRREAIESLVQCMAPFAPHACEEMWESLGHVRSVFLSGWPAFDEAALLRDEVEIVVQVNGKVRDRMKVAAGAPEEQVRASALALPKIKGFVDGKQVAAVKVVPDRLVNIVVKG